MRSVTLHDVLVVVFAPLWVPILVAVFAYTLAMEIHDKIEGWVEKRI